jgi:hypothetical protein
VKQITLNPDSDIEQQRKIKGCDGKESLACYFYPTKYVQPSELGAELGY